MIRAVLLDVDGTLVDSNDLHAESWRVVLTRAGFEISFERVRALIGVGGDKLLPALTGLSAESARGRALNDERSELFLREYAPRARALPGARALVQRILAEGQTPVVATSANERELRMLLQRANVHDLLRLATTSDDADRSKPDPDIVRAALALARAEPNQAVMIGDTPYDLKAAAHAHVRFLGVRSGGYDDHALRGAHAIYQDAAELCAHYEISLLGSA